MSSERKGLLVAVIEDDEAERCALGRLLEAGGFEPALFASAETFSAARHDRAWLCLVVDVHLTGLSGIDLQRRLREEGFDVPIILTTGDRANILRERGEHGGCAAFLWKPVSAETLLALVGSIAERPPD